MGGVLVGLPGLMLVLAVAACGAGGGNPTPTAGHAGQTGRGSAGWAAGVSPGWRVVQALPSEPGSGHPGSGPDDMVSAAAAAHCRLPPAALPSPPRRAHSRTNLR